MRPRTIPLGFRRFTLGLELTLPVSPGLIDLGLQLTLSVGPAGVWLPLKQSHDQGGEACHQNGCEKSLEELDQNLLLEGELSKHGFVPTFHEVDVDSRSVAKGA